MAETYSISYAFYGPGYPNIIPILLSILNNERGRQAGVFLIIVGKGNSVIKAMLLHIAVNIKIKILNVCYDSKGFLQASRKS